MIARCVAGWAGLVGLSELLHLQQQATISGEAGAERVPCTVCTRTFSNVYNLKVHVRDQHSGGGNVKCEVCGVFLKNPSTLRVHKSNYHVRCLACGEYYRNNDVLEDHQKAVHNMLPATAILKNVSAASAVLKNSPAANNNTMLRQYLQPASFEDCIALDDSS